MYASPRYSRHHGGSASYGVGYSPPAKYFQPQEESRPRPQAYSPPLKAYGRYDYYSQGGSAAYYPPPQPQHNQHEYYHSGSSTASSSQDGYYGDDLDDMDEFCGGNPELTTVPTVPTPSTLSKYEGGKTPSGRVLVTQGQQTVEFFSGVVNAPLSRCVFMHE